jgi:tetratricopeptide (TPR) repeat protein/tRNA A-37 threonylcarbamoyl transferase component Bud32
MSARGLLLAIMLLLATSAAWSAPKKTAGAPKPVDYEAIGRISDLKEIPPGVLEDPVKLLQHLQSNPELQQRIGAQWFNRGVAALVNLNEQNRKEAEATTPGGDTGSKPIDPLTGGGATITPAEKYRRELVKIVPDQPWLRVDLGNDAMGRRDYAAALKDYEQAIKLDPANQEAMLGYGHSANELGDYTLAAMAARQLLAKEPGNADALGLYHFATGRAPTVTLPSSIFQGGSAGPGAMNAGAPGAPPAAAGGVAVGGYNAPSQTPEQVVAAARAQAAAAAPGSAERSASITRDAAAALRVKDYQTAHQLASQAIVLNATNAQALNFRAIASNRMHRYNDAVTDASAALALAPGNAPALQTRSWAFAKQGNYQEALKDAEETLTRDPSNPYAYQNKALALAGMKDRAGALDALRRSAAIDPRFQNRLERALQLPQDQDMSLLFDDESAAQAGALAVPPPPQTGKRFARLAVLSGMGGILIALGILHVVSASWREKVHMTIRRALAPSDAVGSDAAVATPQPGSPGTAFWLQYELIKEIGLGGMGVVYEALDRSLERRVAVKKMRDEIRIDPHERRRFVNEAKLVAQLHHPNIVDIYAIVEEGAEVYLVFEFVSGRTLHDQIKSEGPMSLKDARSVLRAAADAVEHAHAAEIVHRDLKPSNIMITDDGRIKVMDFGVARQAKDAITKMSMTNTVVGTPPYMAPEQEQGTVRRESDVYALGVCLYEMLTGHLPFTGGGAAMLLNKLNGKHIPPSQRNPALPASLDEVIAKALTPDPDKRYHTPTELVEALDAVIAQGA